MAQNKFNISKTQSALKHALNNLPAQMGTIAVNFSKQRFREQGWRGAGFYPWRPRKPGSKRNAGRAILVSSGLLRNSIRVVSKTNNSVTIGVSGATEDYAQAHNEGFKGAVNVKQHERTSKFGALTIQAHSRRMNMPKRKFIGKSKTLNNMLIKHIEKELLKAFK